MSPELNNLFLQLDQLNQLDTALKNVKSNYEKKITSDLLLNQKIIQAQFTLDLMMDLNQRLIRYLTLFKNSNHEKTLSFLNELLKKYPEKNISIKLIHLLDDLKRNHKTVLSFLSNEYSEQYSLREIGQGILLFFSLAGAITALVFLAALGPILPVLFGLFAAFIELPIAIGIAFTLGDANENLSRKKMTLRQIPNYDEGDYKNNYEVKQGNTHIITKMCESITVLKSSFFDTKNEDNQSLSDEVEAAMATKSIL